jgi:hypothetical protein
MSSVRECCSCFNWDSSADPAWRSREKDGALSWYCPACWSKLQPEPTASISTEKKSPEQEASVAAALEILRQRSTLRAVDYIPAPKPPWWARLLFSNTNRSAIAFSAFFGAGVIWGLNSDRLGLALLSGLVTGVYAVVFSFLGVYGMKTAAKNPNSGSAGLWLWLTTATAWGIIGCIPDLCYTMLSPHTNESAVDVLIGILLLPPVSGVVGGVIMLITGAVGRIGRRLD